jgi:hypothetical protein
MSERFDVAKVITKYCSEQTIQEYLICLFRNVYIILLVIFLSPVLWLRLSIAYNPFPLGIQTVPVPQPQQFSGNSSTTLLSREDLFRTESLYVIQEGCLFTN